MRKCFYKVFNPSKKLFWGFLKQMYEIRMISRLPCKSCLAVNGGASSSMVGDPRTHTEVSSRNKKIEFRVSTFLKKIQSLLNFVLSLEILSWDEFKNWQKIKKSLSYLS